MIIYNNDYLIKTCQVRWCRLCDLQRWDQSNPAALEEQPFLQDKVGLSQSETRAEELMGSVTKERQPFLQDKVGLFALIASQKTRAEELMGSVTKEKQPLIQNKVDLFTDSQPETRAEELMGSVTKEKQPFIQDKVGLFAMIASQKQELKSSWEV